MDGPLFRSLYAVLILFLSLVKAKFFNKEDFDCNYNPIYPTKMDLGLEIEKTNLGIRISILKI